MITVFSRIRKTLILIFVFCILIGISLVSAAQVSGYTFHALYRGFIGRGSYTGDFMITKRVPTALFYTYYADNYPRAISQYTWFFLKISGLDSTRTHQIICRPYIFSEERWNVFGGCDNYINIPKGRRTWIEEFYFLQPALARTIAGRRKMEIFVDGRLQKTFFYQIKLRKVSVSRLETTKP